MDTLGAIDREPAVYAHHVRALRARQNREDDEAIGAHLTRGGFRDQSPNETKARKTPVHGRIVDFFTASPLTGRDRQSGGVRIPHVDFKPITPTIAPTGTDGQRRAFKPTGMTAAQHVDYVNDGAKIEIASHIDYIGRITGIADPLGELAMDALDELAERDEKNALGRYTNIPGGWARARSLFEAGERAVPAPKTYELLASTADWETFAYARRLASTPDWLRRIEERLRREHDALAAKAAAGGTPIRHRQVAVDSVPSAVAYERLAWLDCHPGLSGTLDWAQGRTGRCQYRFVAELPDGLSARERHAILTEFCDQLSKDGWMVVGAIHQPDATNDKRNFHIHIDLFDRKAEWLEEEGCWDFEHVVRRNGKDTHPHRHKKVRYEALDDDGKPRKVDVAGLMRTRFIDTVNAVVGDRADVVHYLHGTYRDNGIDLTPLDHLGNRAVGLEKRGIETEVGSRNARRIARDEAAACEARAAKAEAALVSELAIIRRIVSNDLQALAAADRYERLQRRLIRRRLQAYLAEVVVAMSRSRADAVIRTLTPAPGHRVKLRAGDAELLADARRHVKWVERHSPCPGERDAEQRALARLDHRAALEWKVVEAATTRLPGEQEATSISYRPRDRASAPATWHPSRYDDHKRRRLTAWLRTHATDRGLLVFEGNEARLGRTVPPAIDTLLRRFANEPAIQRKLISEQRRRDAAVEQGPAMSPSAPGVETSPRVGMIPVDQWNLPKRATPGIMPAVAAIIDIANTVPPDPVQPPFDPADPPTLASEPGITGHEGGRDAGISRSGTGADTEGALNKLEHSLVDKALGRLRRTARSVSRDDAGLYGVDIADLRGMAWQALTRRMADPWVQDALAALFADQHPVPSSITRQSTGSRDEHDHRHTGNDHERHERRSNQALPRRRAGLRPVAGLAGLRVLRAVGVDDRSPGATRLLPDIRGADVRRGSRAVHLEVRGAPADRLTDTADAVAMLVSERASDRGDLALKHQLRGQAEEAVQSTDHRPTRAKGRAGGTNSVGLGKGRDGHER